MKFFFIVTVVCFFSACSNNYKNPVKSSFPHATPSSYTPPLSTANVPYATYEIDAEGGDTIVHPSGSILIFPSNSMVDAQGNLLKGKLKIMYREFYNPLDIFLSGTPMNYDSAGTPYNLQSAGMCEILATQNDIPVFVNKVRPPQIALAAANADPAYNVYYFDSATHQWKYKGKDDICDFKLNDDNAIQNTDTILIKPLPPQKAVADLPLINIKVETGSVPELAVYDNMKFQLDKSENTFKESDSKEEWDDIRIRKTKTAGVYHLVFLHENRKVSYRVKPVFEEEDYEKALIVFNKNNRTYELADAQRKAENRSLEKANNLQLAENEKIDRQNEITLEKNRIAKLNYDRFNKIYEQQVDAQNFRIKEYVLRTFSINQFGIWNCDRPMILQNTIPISLDFKDDQGNSLQNMTAYVVYENLNTLYPISGNIFRFNPDTKSQFWGVSEGEFYYFTYDDFVKASLHPEMKSLQINMHKYAESPISYTKIQKLLGISILNKNLPS